VFAIFGTLGLRMMTLDNCTLVTPTYARREPFKHGFRCYCKYAGADYISPFMLGIALVIKLSSPGPVFIARVVWAVMVACWYLTVRTMIVNADKMGPDVTVSNDPAI